MNSSRLDAHRETLELIFWAIRECLKLALFTAITIYCIASLAQGEFPWTRDFLALLSRLLSG